MADTVVQMYISKTGTAPEIAKAMRLANSTVYKILQVRKTPLHYPLKSVAAQQQRRIKVKKDPVVYSPDLKDQYLVAEPPSPSGVDIDSIHKKPRKSKRKPKTLWQKVMSYFGY